MDPTGELLLEAKRRLDAETYLRVEAGLRNFAPRMGRKADPAETEWFVKSILASAVTVAAPTPKMSQYMREWIDAELKTRHTRMGWYIELTALDRSFAQVWKNREASAEVRVQSALRRVGVKCDYSIGVLPSELPNAFFMPKIGFGGPPRGDIHLTVGLVEILNDPEIAAVVLHEMHHGDSWKEHSVRQRTAAQSEQETKLRRVKVASVRRDIELECDAASIRFGLPADAIIGSLQKLDQRKVELGFASSATRSAVADHPSLNERIQHARKLEAQLQSS